MTGLSGHYDGGDIRFEAGREEGEFYLLEATAPTYHLVIAQPKSRLARALLRWFGMDWRPV